MQVLSAVRNHVAFITLNRPAALNALSLGMVEDLYALLRRCIDDDAVRACFIQGAGERAFCAGGDIRALYEHHQQSGFPQMEFFAAEYPLDYLLHHYPKPYIACCNGITMGGGMGLAQGSRLRIVGERTRMAMPEVAIGFFPDVGGSYFLSRLPGALGMYLALTGTHLRAADCVYAGLADFYLDPAAAERVPAELASLQWPSAIDAAADHEVLETLLRKLAATPAEAPLSHVRTAIDQHFSAANVAQLIAGLQAETRPPYAAWAQDTLKLLRTRSPTMLAVAMHQLQLGRGMSLAQCLRMEMGMVRQTFLQGDFLEGVRAMIIDKDNAPAWRPARLEDVSAAAVAQIFHNPWPHSAHPLANLERTANVVE